MKANELRIGNLIRIQDGVFRSPKEDFVTVDCIEDTPRIGVKESPPLWGYFAEDEIEPIPLTEEWLLKLGFKHHKWGDCYSVNNCRLYKGNDAFAYNIDARLTWSTIKGNIKYVHQLQNLYFALCGEELTIKL